MLRAAISFFILALIASLFGFGGIAGLSVEIARILVGVFIVLAVVTALVYLVTGRSPKLLP